MTEKRRAVITGLGVVAPNGIGLEAFWQATKAGVASISSVPDKQRSGDHHLAWVGGVVQDFNADEHLGRKLAQRTDRMTHLGLVAIQQAISDASLILNEEDPRRVGAVIANSMGGVDYVLKQLAVMYTRGPRFVSAYTAIAWLNVANVGQTAIRHNIQGYCKTPVNDATGGLDAVGMAYNAIRRGAADVMIAGGCEAFLQPIVLQVLARQGIGSPGDDVTEYRPFDRRASGLILAEGAGMCILEEYEHARLRGATIYGEVTGYAQTNDAHGLQAPGSDGTRYAQAMKLAMQEASIEREEIAYISLDGRAVPAADRGEVAALRTIFGDKLTQLPVSVPRTQIGHSYAAAGTIDIVTAMLALKHGIVPPTVHCEELAEDFTDLDLVREQGRRLNGGRAVVVGGRGIGGGNSVLVVKGE